MSEGVIGSAHERTPAFELAWSLATKSGGIELSWELTAAEELYVGDRLWDFDASNTRVPDPFGVYRFVREETLWLVYAQAPHPPGVRLIHTYPPLYSRVAHGERHRRTVLMTSPVDEYSALARDVKSKTAVESVTKAVLVLTYRLRSSMKADPLPPTGEDPSVGFVVYDPETKVSSMVAQPMQVKRRVGTIARYSVPSPPAR